jgi:hypothetical protein
VVEAIFNSGIVSRQYVLPREHSVIRQWLEAIG